LFTGLGPRLPKGTWIVFWMHLESIINMARGKPRRTSGPSGLASVEHRETIHIRYFKALATLSTASFATIEVFGDKGQTYADMLMGNALPTHSETGFGYAVEKGVRPIVMLTNGTLLNERNGRALIEAGIVVRRP